MQSERTSGADMMTKNDITCALDELISFLCDDVANAWTGGLGAGSNRRTSRFATRVLSFLFCFPSLSAWHLLRSYQTDHTPFVSSCCCFFFVCVCVFVCLCPPPGVCSLEQERESALC